MEPRAQPREGKLLGTLCHRYARLPLQQGKGLNGKIWVHSRPWDGLPLPERRELKPFDS